MAIAEYLLDTSALNRLSQPAVEQRIQPLLDRALLATCAMLDLEALYSARDREDYQSIWDMRGALFEYLDTDEVDWQRALEVQSLLSRASAHRGASLPDLVVAAVAERNQIAVIHYDSDYDTIAGITGQRMEWVVPRGTAT